MIDLTDPENVDVLDTLVVAGQPMPGIVSFPKAADSPRKWDERKGTGLSGATIVFVGLDVAKFTTRLTLWLPQHFQAWEQRKRLVAPPPQGQKATILDVYNPLLDEVGLRAAGVENRTMLQPVSDLGDWFVDIMWLSYRKPLPQVSVAGNAKAQYTQQNSGDAGNAQIQSLLKQLNDLTK